MSDSSKTKRRLGIATSSCISGSAEKKDMSERVADFLNNPNAQHNKECRSQLLTRLMMTNEGRKMLEEALLRRHVVEESNNVLPASKMTEDGRVVRTISRPN